MRFCEKSLWSPVGKFCASLNLMMGFLVSYIGNNISSWKKKKKSWNLLGLSKHFSLIFCATILLKQKDTSYNRPSASRAISCRRPVVPRSMPVRSSSSLSKNELAVDESERSVTCPTFIGRPASSKPFSCSKAFFAHSASANFKKQRGWSQAKWTHWSTVNDIQML